MKSEQKITIFVVLLTAFITSFTGSALNLTIPDISAEFDAGAGLSGWIITGYTLTVAVSSVPAGRIADIRGRRKVLIIGLIIFSAASVVSAIGLSIWMLIISRAVQGAGAAMIFSTNTAILAEAFSDDKRGRMMGYSLAATYVGLSAGPVLGGILNYNLGWRSILYITAAVSAAALFMSVKSLPDGKTFAERHSVSYRDKKAYVCSSAAAFLNYGATFTVSYLLSVYLQVVMGYSSQKAGFILLIQPVIISILSPLAGKISDSVSPFRLSAVGMAVCAAGIALGIFLNSEMRTMFSDASGIQADIGALWIIIAVLAVVGAGSALFSSPNTNAVMSAVEKKDYSAASAVLSTMRAGGNTVGMLLVNAVTVIYLGNTQLKQASPDMITKTLVAVFIISASACALGVILAMIKSGKRR